MQLKFFALAATALAGLVVAQDIELQSSITPETVKATIMAVTDLSRDTADIIRTLNPLNLIVAVPRTIANFGNIVRAIATDGQRILDADFPDPFSEEGQREICEAFRDFVRVHIALLDTLIGRAGILSTTPFTAPIAAVLRLIESGVDELAFGIIDLVPVCAEMAEMEKEKLDQSFTIVIERFS